MQTIEYRVHFTGIRRINGVGFAGDPESEVVRVQARDINSGFAKALKRAKEKLGNGLTREIGSIEFSQVV